MKQIQIIIALVILLSYQLKSQSLSEIISNPNLTYFEKTQLIEDNKTQYLKNADDADVKRYDRWLTFWDSRVDNKGSFSSYLNAIQNYTMSNKSENQHIWNILGPVYGNFSDGYDHIGRIESIWVNPEDTSEIFVGSHSGGLFKTNDGGISWRLLTENYSFGVQGIDVDTENSIIYIATGISANGMLLDSAEDRELKRYDRWLTFWDSRIDNKGEYTNYLIQ